MTTPFTPDPGDTIEFYNSEAELWEPGTVSSYAADRRLYFVEPDEESQSGWLVNHSNIRPLADATPVEAPSFWGAAKSAVRQRNAWQAVAVEDATRAEKAEADLTQCRKALHDAIGEAAEVEKERDKARARAEKAEGLLSEARVGWKTSDEAANAAEARIEELEAKLQAQTDAAPYATGYPVGDRVAARIAEYRERAKDEESRGDRLADMLNTTIDERDAMTRRVEELKHELQVETHRRLEWMKLAHAAQSRESELKAALRTLGGESR